MNKSAVVVACCTFGLTILAGTRIEGPVSLVDATGESRYEYVLVNDIVGKVDCLEVVGCKASGIYETRRYLDSAMPKSVVSGTNIVAVSYQILQGGKFRLDHCHGLDVSLASITETNCVLVVGIDGDKAACGHSTCVAHPAGWHSWALVDDDSGLSFVGNSNKRCNFYTGCLDSMRVSFYANEAGAMKIWYEVVDASHCVKVRGWIQGMITGRSFVEKESKVVSGDDGFKPHVEVRQIPAPNEKVEAKTWVGFAVCKGDMSSSYATIMGAFTRHVVD